MSSEVEEIKTRLNIIDVLGEYLKLDKAGANWKATCPFHNEKTPSFMVSEEKQIWHCFGCQKSGDIFSFVMEMEGLEFREALKILAEKAGVEIRSYNPKKTEEKNRTLEILELATKWYEHQLWNGPGKNKIIKYLKERGLKEENIKEFRLGYAPKGWRNILSFLLSRSFKLEEIARTGLLVEKRNAQISNKKQDADCYDRFRERIMFPIADYSGKIVGYSARIAPGRDESQAKYVNTPETEVYHKSRILYGIDKAKKEIKVKDYALLVEGNMDVIACYQAGMKNTVAVSGTALAQEQVGIIKRYTRNLKMFFDMDSAGEAATKKSVKICFENDMTVKIVSLPEGKDAAELAKDNLPELKKAVTESKPAMEYFFKNTFSKFDKKKVEDKKKITDELLETISYLENLVEKNHWLKKLSEILEISESALTDMLKKVNLKSRLSNNVPAGSPDLANFLSKTEMLSREITGLMLVSSEVWKEAEKEAKNGIFLPEDSLLSFAIEKGNSVKYDFDKFIGLLGNNEELRSKAEKVYFQKKYQLDLNNNLEEYAINDTIAEFRIYLKELKKEKRREELARITADLKSAEEKKDKEAIVFLRQEYNKISKELAKLVK